MITPENTCFFTGHRLIANAKIEYLKNKIMIYALKLIENYNVTNFITGGAIGFDTLAAYTILDLKQIYPQIKLHLYLPCTNQTHNWRKIDIDRWNDILMRADSHRYVYNDLYITGCMQLRNRTMVRDAEYCIAYCTRKKSGSYSTVAYAKEHDRKIIMLK